MSKKRSRMRVAEEDEWLLEARDEVDTTVLRCVKTNNGEEFNRLLDTVIDANFTVTVPYSRFDRKVRLVYLLIDQTCYPLLEAFLRRYPNGANPIREEVVNGLSPMNAFLNPYLLRNHSMNMPAWIRIPRDNEEEQIRIFVDAYTRTYALLSRYVNINGVIDGVPEGEENKHYLAWIPIVERLMRIAGENEENTIFTRALHSGLVRRFSNNFTEDNWRSLYLGIITLDSPALLEMYCKYIPGYPNTVFAIPPLEDRNNLSLLQLAIAVQSEKCVKHFLFSTPINLEGALEAEAIRPNERIKRLIKLALYKRRQTLETLLQVLDRSEVATNYRRSSYRHDAVARTVGQFL